MPVSEPSVTLSFANNFWGKDDAGVGPLLQRMHDAKTTCEELKSFYLTRYQIEDEYSKRMIALSRKPFGSCESGSLKASMDVLRQEVESMGKAHQHIASQMKTELEEPLGAFAGAMRERRKIVQGGVEKLMKLKIQQTQQVNKTRDRYEQDCLRIKGYLAQGHMVMGQEERKNKAKLEKAQIQLASSNAEYENAIKALEDTTQRWNRDWKAACDKFQDLEEERIDFIKSSLWTFANVASTVCVSDDASCEKVRLSLENCEVEKDITSFIRDRGTGQEIPDPPKYINFCRGDLSDDGASEAAEDSYSVAQFSRQGNPAYRSSSPNPSNPSTYAASDVHDEPSTPTQASSKAVAKRRSMGVEPRSATKERTPTTKRSSKQPQIANTAHNDYPLDGMTMYCRATPSDRSSASSPARPPSSHASSDYSSATSVSSGSDTIPAPSERRGSTLRGLPTSSANASSHTLVERPREDDRHSEKKKKGIFGTNSPFRRKSRSEKSMKEAALAREVQLREMELQQQREIEEQERQREVQQRELALREQEQRDLQAKEQRLRELQQKEQQLRELQAQEQQLRERQQREQQDRERQQREQQDREQQQLLEQQQLELQQREQQLREQQRELQLKEQQQRTLQEREQAARRELQAREQQQKELEERQHQLQLQQKQQQNYQADRGEVALRDGRPRDHLIKRESESATPRSNRGTWSGSAPPRALTTPQLGGSASSRHTPALMDSPDPIDPRASLALNIGGNVFDIASSAIERNQQKIREEKTPVEDTEPLDPIAAALAELKGVTKATPKPREPPPQPQSPLDYRKTADRFYGLQTPAPPQTPSPQSATPTPMRRNVEPVAAAQRGTPPPSYHSPVKRSTLGTPAPAFTAAEMKERTREYQEKSQFMLEGPPMMPAAQAEMRPGTRGSDRTASRQSGRGSVGGRDSLGGFNGSDVAHTGTPAPNRSVSPRPQSYHEQQQQLQQDLPNYQRSASPKPPSIAPSQASSGYRASPAPTAPLNFSNPTPSPRAEPREPVKQSPTEYRASPAPTVASDGRNAHTPTPIQPLDFRSSPKPATPSTPVDYRASPRPMGPNDFGPAPGPSPAPTNNYRTSPAPTQYHAQSAPTPQPAPVNYNRSRSPAPYTQSRPPTQTSMRPGTQASNRPGTAAPGQYQAYSRAASPNPMTGGELVMANARGNSPIPPTVRGHSPAPPMNRGHSPAPSTASYGRRHRSHTAGPGSAYGDQSRNSFYDDTRSMGGRDTRADTRNEQRPRSKSVVHMGAEVTRDGLPILKYARALYSYTPVIGEELGFSKGDVLAILRLQDDGWWEGEVVGQEGIRGLVPSNYLQNV